MINYVINLDRRADRWEEFVEKLKKQQEFSKDTFIRISAFDGYKHEEEIKRYNLENFNLIKFLIQNKVIVKKGVLGCFMSHVIALYNILQNKDIKDDDYVGIYEDDIFYPEDFEEKYKKFKEINLGELDIEFIYTGGRLKPGFDCKNENMFQKTENPDIYFRKNPLEGGYNWERTTSSYIIRKSSCEKLIKLLTTQFSTNSLRLIPIDGLLIKFFKDIKMFDYFPHLFYSEIYYKTDVQTSDEDLIYF
jgi:GR25 family glycosyltransferase involved in LPS biosynthesis